MSCRRCGGRSTEELCVSCAQYLKVIDRGYHRIWVTVYESEADVSRCWYRQVEIEVPERVWAPDVVQLWEAPLGSTYATVATYERREEWLNGRRRRVYYVRRQLK